MKISDYDLEKMYLDFLDEIYGEVKIAGYNYMTGRTLQEIDPTAFRTGLNDWLDDLCAQNLLFYNDQDGEYYDDENDLKPKKKERKKK